MKNNTPKSQEYPDWYWVSGLHDACIIGVDTLEFPFDYKKCVTEKEHYSRNVLILKLKASGAMFDHTVKEIRFYNYKILTKEISLQGRGKIWWLGDVLTESNGHYNLEIDLQDLDADPTDFTFRLQFDRAEVDRKG